jgi:pimeloyl-ACP methyl ester carboxylesterase
LDHFKLSKFNILGDHTGASIAVAFAATHPDRVDSLIIHGPPIFDPETLKILMEQRFDQTPRVDGSHLVDRWTYLSSILGSTASVAQKQQAFLLTFLAGSNEWYAHDAIFRYDLVPVIKGLIVPTLLINNPGDSLQGAAQQVKLMRPDFKYVELKSYGKHVIYDDPKPWAEAVALYLKK